MRNPDWLKDEIILALDLYFSPNRGSIDDKNPKIIELSTLLRALPLIQNKPDEAKFRNPSGVTLKLSNFLPFDPNYKGIGMKRGSKLDGILFREFYNDRERLKEIADSIRRISSIQKIKDKVISIESEDANSEYVASEGQILYKYHKVIERDKKIVAQKKSQVLKINGKLECEVCSFNFESYYGESGKGFIECHHKTPLAKISIDAKTKLDDLALVCANCHRMLHRKISTLSIDDLKMIVKLNQKIS